MIIFDGSKHLVEFGKGTVSVVPGLNMFDEGVLFFRNARYEGYKSGDVVPIEDMGLDINTVNKLSEVIFTFDDIDAVDNLITALKSLKRLMKDSRKEQEL